MYKDLSQDWLDWILENINRGCEKTELLDILLNEGFDPVQSKIILGLELNNQEIFEAQESHKKSLKYSSNNCISAERIKNVSAEIYEVDNFLTPEECEILISEIKRELRPSTIASSGAEDSSYRTSSTCDLGIIEKDFLKDLDDRICNFVGIDSSYGETLQGQNYQIEQEFKIHTDYFEESQMTEHDKGKGQRTYTFMIYLNEVAEGGETEFPRLNKKFSPSTGKVLIWNNLNEDGSPNINTLHQAFPVKRGEKNVITKWFRQKGDSTDSIERLNKHVKTYTKKGFKKEFLDKNLFEKLKDFFEDNKSLIQDEYVSGNFIQSGEQDVPSTLLELNDELKKEIHESLKLPLESWSGAILEPTYVYGIRDYKKGAILIPHRDRDVTHIISAIINIHQELEEDWPLIIDDHFYRKNKVILEPGEVIFYESARLSHGRPYPLKGKSYANIFCHFRPVS